MIAIINYNMGNLRSVLNAFLSLGVDAEIVSDSGKLHKATHVVLPGVGAFGDGMRNLREYGWDDVLFTEVMRKRKPFLGICLGMQLIAKRGTEHDDHEGLGWIEGDVTRLENCSPSIRIPHIGWNTVDFLRNGRIFTESGDSRDFYFVHSYALKKLENGTTIGICEHGEKFVAALEKDNIFATQFHPEKSQKFGLEILKKFAELSG